MFEANTVSMSCENESNSELMLSNTKLHAPPLQDEDGMVTDIALHSNPELESPSVRVYDVVDPSISSVMLIEFYIVIK